MESSAQAQFHLVVCLTTRSSWWVAQGDGNVVVHLGPVENQNMFPQRIRVSIDRAAVAQNLKFLCRDSLIGAIKGYKLRPYLLMIFQAVLSLPDCMDKGHRSLPGSLDLLQSHLLFWAVLESGSFWVIQFQVAPFLTYITASKNLKTLIPSPFVSLHVVSFS